MLVPQQQPGPSKSNAKDPGKSSQQHGISNSLHPSSISEIPLTRTIDGVVSFTHRSQLLLVSTQQSKGLWTIVMGFPL
jgi:hypothetical protein